MNRHKATIITLATCLSEQYAKSGKIVQPLTVGNGRHNRINEPCPAYVPAWLVPLTPEEEIS